MKKAGSLGWFLTQPGKKKKGEKGKERKGRRNGVRRIRRGGERGEKGLKETFEDEEGGVKTDVVSQHDRAHGVT